MKKYITRYYKNLLLGVSKRNTLSLDENLTGNIPQVTPEENNGENGPYFKTYGGLRQGDSLSTLIFNLAADALTRLQSKAKEHGCIKSRGVVPHIIPGQITHLQYADDMVVMVDCNQASIQNPKFLRCCFEWMSGLKINYHKSEAVSYGVDKETNTE